MRTSYRTALLMRSRRRVRSHGDIFTMSLSAVAILVCSCTLVFGLLAMGVVAYAAGLLQLVAPTTLLTSSADQGSTKIYDRNGELLYEFMQPGAGYRTNVVLSDISPYLVAATLAVEDPTFYDNPGIDPRGIVRAAWQNVVHRDVVQGGSSITQQLVKNVLLPENERTDLTIQRKLKEALAAFELTRAYSKTELLTFYFNDIYYGNLSYGAEAAAQGYFGKGAHDVSLAEAALLAGIPQAPAYYNPLSNRDTGIARQYMVLDLMVKHGFLSREAADAAKAEELQFVLPTRDNIQAPHFVMYVRDLLEQRYGHTMLSRGLVVTTSLDLRLQRLAETAVAEQVAKTSKSIGASNAALTAINPHTGEIVAMVGSANYFDSSIDGEVNIATSERQPGSSFKPFTYVTAFQKGYSPATMLVDAPMAVKDGANTVYRPQNFDRSFRGPVSVRTALSNSMNIPALKTIEFTGVDSVLKTAHAMGITTLNRQNWYGISLTLGGGEVMLLDMTYAYSVFANQGVMAGVSAAPERPAGLRALDPVALLRVQLPSGRVVDSFETPDEQRILRADHAYLITNILSDNLARRPVFGSTLDLPGGRPAAVKTGTTEDLRDFWTMGYTPDLAVGVWMGNADGARLRGGLSSTTTGPIWLRFMAEALEGTPITPFDRPANIVTAVVCDPSGLLPTDNCGNKHEEVFVRGTVPTLRDTLYQKVNVDSATGELVGSCGARGAVVEEVRVVLPGSQAQVADRDCASGAAGGRSTRVALTAPGAGQVLRGSAAIRVTAGPDVDSYSVDLGAGSPVTAWVPLLPSKSGNAENAFVGTLDTVPLHLGGPYSLRLTARLRDGSTRAAVTSFTVDNGELLRRPGGD